MIWQVALGLAVGLLLCWAVLLVALWRAAPEHFTASDAIRLLPDVLGLIGRLSRDAEVPRRVRLWLWLLLAYLAMPFDIVPDFIPVVGYADDAIVVAIALRAVVKTSGLDAVRRQWRGSEDGLAVVLRLCLGSGGRTATEPSQQ